MRKAILGVAVLAMTIAGGVSIAAPASAATGPRVTFRFAHAQITAGKKPTVVYRVSNASRRAYVVVQRQMGTAHVWKNVATAQPNSGKLALPAVQMGEYGYRVLAKRGRRVVATSNVETLKAFGPVPWSTLCQVYGNHNESDCGHGTRDVNGTLFTFYEHFYYGATSPKFMNALKIRKSSSCRSISVQWFQQGPSTSHSSMKVVQTATDQQLVTDLNGQVNSATFKLDGGPAVLSFSTDGNASNDTFFNGTASCYTANTKV